MAAGFGLLLIGLFLLDLIPGPGTLVGLMAFLGAAVLCIPAQIKRLHEDTWGVLWLVLFHLLPLFLEGASGMTGSFIPASLFAVITAGISASALVDPGPVAGAGDDCGFGSDPLKGAGWRTA